MRVNDSVRRAAQHKHVRNAHQRDLLHTIVDEKHPLSPLATSVAPGSAGSAIRTQQQQHPTALLSPVGGASDEGTSPQFPKKLVFSPDELQQQYVRSRLSGGSKGSIGAVTPEMLSQQPLPSSVSSIHSGRSSLSPVGSRGALPAPRFVSPPPPRVSGTPPYATGSSAAQSTGSVASAASTVSRFMSPQTLVSVEDEGLLGQEELFFAPDSFDAEAEAEARAAVEAEDDDDNGDEEEDEVVFGATDVDTHRRVSNSRVDPNAPTPLAQRTQQRYVQDDRTPPPPSQPQQQGRSSLASSTSFRSPTYDFGSGQGLLDDDEQ